MSDESRDNDIHHTRETKPATFTTACTVGTVSGAQSEACCRRLRVLIETLTESAIIVGCDGTILAANQAAASLTGMSIENMLDRKIPAMFPNAITPLRKEHFRKVLETKKAITFEDESRKGVFLRHRLSPVSDAKGDVREVVIVTEDLSAYKKAKTRVLEQDLLFRDMFEEHSSVMLLIDNEAGGAIINANKAAVAFYGYPKDELISMNISDINVSPQHEIIASMVEAARRMKNYFVFQHRLATGDVRDVEIHSTPIVTSGRKILFSVIHDITERKEMERKLARAHDRLLAVLDNLHAVVYVADITTYEVLFANKHALQVFGESVGKRCYDVFSHTLNGTPCDHCENDAILSLDGKPQGMQRIERQDPQTGAWYLCYASAIEWTDKRYAHMEVAFDITRQKSIEVHLRYLSMLERLINEISQNIIGSKAEEIDATLTSAIEVLGKFTEIDESYIYLFDEDVTHAHRAYSWSAGRDVELRERSLLFSSFPYLFERLKQFDVIEIANVEDLPKKHAFERTYFTSKGVTSLLVVPIAYGFELLGYLEFDSLTKRREWREDEIAILRLAGGIFANAVIHKRTESALRQYTRELERTNEEIRGFNQIITHDLRAPLANIKGFAYELKDECLLARSSFDAVRHTLPEKERGVLSHIIEDIAPEYLEYITTSTLKMERLANSVLGWFRIGKRELYMESIDTTKVVTQILASFDFRLKEQKITVSVGELPTVVVDREAIEHVFNNLIDNAIKYMPKKEGAAITITAEEAADEVAFFVKDNGRGIKEREREKIFYMFQRAGDQSVPGEGIGLAYVKTLIEKHEGRIWCTSEVGKGTVFSFTIPKQYTSNAFPPR